MIATESNVPSLSRKDRLFAIMEQLRGGELTKAGDLAAKFGVAERTIYRDMKTLMESGFPVSGDAGKGYRLTADVVLPALNLTMAETEVLHLGIAVMSEADDPNLRDAARSLARKVDQSLPEGRLPDNLGWGIAVHPFADTAAGIKYMPVVRQAIRERKKLKIALQQMGEDAFEGVVRPMKLDYWGRIWTCTAWAEQAQRFVHMRLDQLESAELLPVGFSIEETPEAP